MAFYGLIPVSTEGAAIEELVVENGQALVKYDPVFLENDGSENTVDLCAAGEPIYGVCMTASITGDGTVKAQILKARPGMIFLMDNDNDTDTFGTTNDRGAGNYFNIIGGSGAVQVDTSSGGTVSATKQLVCVKENPDSSDVSAGHFKVNMLQA